MPKKNISHKKGKKMKATRVTRKDMIECSCGHRIYFNENKDITMELHSRVCPHGGIPRNVRNEYHAGVQAVKGVVPVEWRSGINYREEQVHSHSRYDNTADESKAEVLEKYDAFYAKEETKNEEQKKESNKRRRDDEDEDEDEKPKVSTKTKRRKFVPPTVIDNLRKGPKGPPPSSGDSSGNAIIV